MTSISPDGRSVSPTHSQAESTASSSQTRISVNVCVRVKPITDAKQGSGCPQVVDSMTDTTISLNSLNQVKKYAFDRVFDPSTKQENIFEYVEPSISAFLQGYNVSLMAYGQSGSGKSYTMGTTDSHVSTKVTDDMGLIERVSNELFNRLAQMNSNQGGMEGGVSYGMNSMNSSLGSPKARRTPGATMSGLKPPTHINLVKTHRKTLSTSVLVSSVSPMASGSPMASKVWQRQLDNPFSVSVSYLEIYNEQIRDLLNHEANTNTTSLLIREDAKGVIYTKGLKEKVVTDFQGLLQILNESSALRQVGSTAINNSSSRSHAIFTVKLTRRVLNPDTGIITTITSKMNFVDLAGSERLKNIGVNDGRVKEGISINSGLASLGKVISQLSLQRSHVSYRDSKLTRLLQDSLGGKAITYLIACVTTDPLYVSETLNTLAYAQRARSIQLAPEVHEITEIHSKDDLSTVVAQLQQELHYYKSIYESEAKQQVESKADEAEMLNDSRGAIVGPVESNTLASLKDVTRDRISRSRNIHNAVEEAISVYDEAILSLKDQIKELKLSQGEIIAANGCSEKDMSELKAINDLLRKRIEYLEGQNEKHNSTHDNSRNTLEDQNTPIVDNSHQWEIESLKSEIQAYRREHRANQSELQYITAQYNRVRRDLENAKLELGATKIC